MIPKEITIEEMRIVYAQESDSCDPGDPGQQLEIFSQDAGGGKFLCIKTDRWAIDNDEYTTLTQILEDFKERLRERKPEEREKK